MIKVNENIKIQKIGNQYLVKDSKNEFIHVLDKIAGEILIEIQKGASIEGIVNKIVEQYEGAQENIVYEDVKELIQSFEAKMIIQ